MSANPEIVRNKVQSILERVPGPVELGQNGTWTLRHGSARAWVSVNHREGRDWTYVNITVPILQKMTASPELYEYIAKHTDDYIFGHLYVEEWDSGAAILFSHNLLGEYLDEEELLRALFGLLSSADDLDDELKAKFGGERYYED